MVSTLLIVIQLIFLEGILSIDNAAVLGAMVAHLPNDEHLPWPRGLRWLGLRLKPVLHYQREAALRVGLLGAYLGRGLMLLAAEFVIQNPWLKVIGALYLIHLAFENLGQSDKEEADGPKHHAQRTFWEVVVAVELTDLIFSLDNVVAAVALSKEFWVVMLGVAIGILLMRFAAGWFSYAVQREPILETAAYVLVLAIGVELIAEELAGVAINDILRFSIAVAIILSSLAYSHVPALQIFKPGLVFLSKLFGAINTLVDWLFTPVAALGRLMMRSICAMFRVDRAEEG